MAKRIVTKIGDVFCTEIDGKYKYFFQYIANDMTQLNSSVIRAFKTRYPINYTPVIEDIVKDEVSFYAHTVLRAGIQYNAWYKVGKSAETGIDELNKVIFSLTCFNLYIPPKLIPVNPLENWQIWHINDKFIEVGKLPEKYHEIVELGIVMPYNQIINRIKHGYYTAELDYYDIIKRIPLPYADSYVKEEADDKTVYYHFLGQNVIRELIVENGKRIRLTSEKPDAGGHTMRKEIFSDTVWHFKNFISEEEFENAWEGKKQ